MYKLFVKMLSPPAWAIMLLTAFSTVALLYVFVSSLEKSVVAYVAYLVSFYTLSVVCVALSKALPKRCKAVKRRVSAHPIGRRYLTEPAFRTHISLYCTLGVNLLYAVANVLSFVMNKSLWFVTMAGYYAILSVMRFLLVRYVRKVGIGVDKLGELKSSVVCSAILSTLNIVLAGVVSLILYQNSSFEYNGIMIYAMAMYTFYITIHAIVNLVKYRKYNSPVMMTAKVISMSSALVSMLALETAMFGQFGQAMTAEGERLMVALTGAGVSGVVVTMSVYMIVKSVREIKKIQSEKA